MTEPTSETPYLVRLMVSVTAEDANDAVLEMVDSITATGLRNWVYRVETHSGEIAGYFNGYGEEIDLDDLEAKARTPDIDGSDEGETDEDLETFAESLGDVPETT